MRRLTLIAVAFCLAAPAGRAQDGNGCASVTHAARAFTACTYDPATFEFRLFLAGPDKTPLLTLGRLVASLPKDKPPAMAMNAGMYHRDFSPVGLLVQGGRQSSPALTGASAGNFGLLPNGVFHVEGGRAAVTETKAFLKSKVRPDLATQSGPMLVIANALHPKISARGTSRHIRNGVGVRADGRVVFAISEDEVTFHEFATLFRDSLHCPDALYFDGSVSSLHAPALGRDDLRAPLGPMIGVFARAKK